MSAGMPTGGAMRTRRILITGHTSGLGLQLYDHYRSTDHICGVSRSTGHDITTVKGRSEIATLSLAYEIFINNAWADYGQCHLFHQVYNLWKDTNRTGVIINIGSRAGIDVPVTGASVYQKSKRALLEMSDEFAKQKHPGLCVSCINFGYIKTEPYKDKVAIPLYKAARIVDRVINDGLENGIQHRHMTVEALPH